MPTLSITSKTTGQTFDVEFKVPPTESLINEATAEWDKQFYQREGLSPSIEKQGAGESFARAGMRLGTNLVEQAGTAIGGTLNAMENAAADAMDQPRKGTYKPIANFGKAIGEAGRDFWAVNPANPTARIVGEGVGQAATLLATAGAAAPAMGMKAAMATVPLVMGGALGMGQGIETAERMGIENPYGQLAMGGAFAGVEALTERMGGIGGKAAAEMLQSGVRAGLKQAGKTVLGEAIEEPIAGTLQDIATVTAGQFVEDPNNPGYTIESGYQLPSLNPLNPQFLERRKQEALGGAAGGLFFGGLQMAGNVNAGPSAAGSTPAVDALNPEHTGDFTVADLPVVEPIITAPTPRAPILGNVPDAIVQQPTLTPAESAPADQTVPDAIAGVTATPTQTITGSNVQMGTEMPAPPPTADAGAGAGEMVAQPQVGDVVSYEGYAGRLQQDGQRLVVEVPNGPVVEVADPAGVQRATYDTVNQVRVAELQTMPDPQVSEAQFAPAGDGTLSLKDSGGNTYVPHNDQLLRSVRTNEAGGVEVLLRNPKRPGQVIKLTGKQAEQAQDAILAAAINVEEQGGTVRYGTAKGLQNLQGNNRSNAGSTTLPGAAVDSMVNMAQSAVRAGKKFTAWASEMVKRFGETIRKYLAQVWAVAKDSLPTTAARNVRLGGAQGTAPVGLSASGAVINPNEDKMRENRSRMALSEEDQRMYEAETNAGMLAQAEQWLAGVDDETAVRQLESGLPPDGLRFDHLPALTERTLQRLMQQTTSKSEIERMKSDALLDRAFTAHQDIINRMAGTALQQVGAANDRLALIMPIMGAKKVLIDRAEALVKSRFKGGRDGVKAKIEKILADADLDISERVERILATVRQSALKPITSIKDAVAGLVAGKSQREQMIEDVAQALMTKARGNVVTPERKTALAALAASLKQTLGASVQGDAKKAATSPLGEVLARAFVDQVSEAKLFAEAWLAGRQSVFDMFYDMELDKAYHPARMRAEQAASRLSYLEAGSTDQQAGSAAERAELKQTIEGLRAEMKAAKAKADGMTDAFWKQVAVLMPATPTMAYAPGMSKEAIKRGFEQAGYTAEIKTGMKQDGTRALNVQDALRDPKRAMTAVLAIWDAEAVAAGIDPAAWQEGRKLAWGALNETLAEWQKKADERAEKLAQAQKDALMAKDSPALMKLLKGMMGKIAPGMSWTEIFTDLPSTQKARQLAIYDRLLKDGRLQALTQDERIALTNELDKAWMRERRTVFNRELTKAGILGEKAVSDRLKVKNAMPKLLRLINLGMFNSEMFREVIAPEYKLRVIDAKTAGKLRGMAEAAYAQPEGVLRNRKLGELLTAMQSATGSTLAELVNNYWTAAVLSGTRTQFDTWTAAVNGMGTNLIQASTLLARGRGKDAVAVHMAWWRALIDGTRESVQILAKGDYSVLKRFGGDVNKAMDGESAFRPVPLGESLWKNGNTFQKYAMAPVMIWTGRLMAAADHVNNTATTAGAMAVARALHPELYGKVTFSELDQANARAQALREVTGGTEPTTSADRATVSVRVRELLYGSMREAERLEANEIGDMAAFQNDPTGLFGGVYAALKGGLGIAQRALEGESNDMEANKAYRAMMGLMAGSLHGLTGARFMRFGFNSGAEITRYVPGTALIDMATSGKLYGKEAGKMQKELLLGKNLVGLMLASTLAALFLGGDDDEEGWQMEGDWSGLTPQQSKERMSAGLERMTMWKREGVKVRRYSYKQWPTMGLFAVVGGMLDEKRHKPAQWAQRGVTGHLLRGMGTGLLQIKNVGAVRNLVELFGGTRFAGDPSTGMIDDVVKVGTNFAGGMIPTLLKDVDVWTDSRNFKADSWLEELQRATPIARRFVNDGRPQLNLLGEEVKLQRAPWSRGYTSVESGEAGRVLGALLGRGLNLPQPSDSVMVYQNGVKVPLEKLGREKVWQYEKAVGTAYKAWLSTEGAALLTLPVQQADKVIERRAAAIKRQALAKVAR